MRRRAWFTDDLVDSESEKKTAILNTSEVLDVSDLDRTVVLDAQGKAFRRRIGFAPLRPPARRDGEPRS